MNPMVIDTHVSTHIGVVGLLLSHSSVTHDHAGRQNEEEAGEWVPNCPIVDSK